MPTNIEATRLNGGAQRAEIHAWRIYEQAARRACDSSAARREIVGSKQNIDIANALISGFANGVNSRELAKMFSRGLSFEIQGDEDLFAWVGRKTGRAAAAEFFENVRSQADVVRCNVEDILGAENRAVVVGEFACALKASGVLFKSQFALVLTVAEGEIIRFQLLEDSFGLSRALRD